MDPVELLQDPEAQKKTPGTSSHLATQAVYQQGAVQHRDRGHSFSGRLRQDRLGSPDTAKPGVATLSRRYPLPDPRSASNTS